MRIEFSGQIFEKYVYFLKILLVGVFHEDRRTDGWTHGQIDIQT